MKYAIGDKVEVIGPPNWDGKDDYRIYCNNNREDYAFGIHMRDRIGFVSEIESLCAYKDNCYHLRDDTDAYYYHEDWLAPVETINVEGLEDLLED